ncbi:MAG: nicotinamidase [Anaerolineae bacterium]|nr:nicotinamidase [Anaerolineae bacterium]
MTMLHLPDFYRPDRIGSLYAPATAEAIAAGQQAGLSPARKDASRIILLLVDPQVDFIHVDGSLSVPGAVDDTRRTIEWLFRHASEVTTVVASLDSHIPTQIFYPSWWVDEAGQPPPPYTAITGGGVDAGRWRPIFEREWSRAYVHELEARAKKQLMIWPHHTMIGTPGHAISPALYEAIAYHSAARQSQPTFLTKGLIPKTEHYSLLEPEVKVPDHPQGELNTAFLKMLASYDLIYVAGQAKSHCVLETMRSVMTYFEDQPEQVAKWRVLIDCTSSVVHPDIDFDALAEAAFARYTGYGLKLVKSTDPIG